MPDPLTIGALAAALLSMAGVAGDAALKGVAGEAAKDAYHALKKRVQQWTGGGAEAAGPADSPVHLSAMAKAIDARPDEEKAGLAALVIKLIVALKDEKAAGLDMPRLEAMEALARDLIAASKSRDKDAGLIIDELEVDEADLDTIQRARIGKMKAKKLNLTNVSAGAPEKKA